MDEQTQLDWRRIRQNAGPYPPDAYLFVQEGLRHTVDIFKTDDPDHPSEGRHVSGRELCLGLRDYAKKQYGLLARDVLEHWRIQRTEDFGRIVFAMVEAGLLRKSEEDSMSDFTGVYDFDESFETITAGGAADWA